MKRNGFAAVVIILIVVIVLAVAGVHLGAATTEYRARWKPTIPKLLAQAIPPKGDANYVNQLGGGGIQPGRVCRTH